MRRCREQPTGISQLQLRSGDDPRSSPWRACLSWIAACRPLASLAGHGSESRLLSHPLVIWVRLRRLPVPTRLELAAQVVDVCQGLIPFAPLHGKQSIARAVVDPAKETIGFSLAHALGSSALRRTSLIAAAIP